MIRSAILALVAALLTAGCGRRNERLAYKVYVTNRDAGTVTVIEPRAGFPTRTIGVGRNPTYIAATQAGDLVLVANTGDSTVSFVDTESDSVVATLKLGGLLKGVEVAPGDSLAFVADEGGGHVVVVRIRDRSLVKRIRVGAEPHNFAFDSITGEAFVSCAGTGAVDIIDLAALTRVGSIRAGGQPHNLVIHEGTLVVTSRDRPLVYVVGRDGARDSVPVSTGHHGITLWDSGGQAYVTGIGSDTVSIVDIRDSRRAGAAPVSDGPHGIEVSPDGLLLFVAASRADAVDVISRPHAMGHQAVRSPGFPFWVAVAELGDNQPGRRSSLGFRDITVDELAAMLEDKDFLLVNVHVPYAGEIAETDVHIPYDQIEQRLDELPADRASKIVVYCQSGHMSAIAARELVSLGFGRVYNLTAGFAQWQAVGHELVR